MRESRRTRADDVRRRPEPRPEHESPRTSRTRPRRAARRRGSARPWIGALVAFLFVAVAGTSIALMAPKAKSAVAGAANVWLAAGTSTATPAPAKEADTPSAPTPVFASFQGVQLRIPVPVDALTVLAFHESSYADTFRMKPLTRIGSASAAKAALQSKTPGVITGISPDDTSDQTGADGIWTGSVLELWRSGRQGDQDSAIDCGGAPGTPVFSMVDGVVMHIRPYKLYGKYPDYEIDIKPDGLDTAYVVVLHVTDPAVAEGTHVIGGVTQIAQVRCLSKSVSGLQLRNYSPDGGNHTHVQINKLPKPGEEWLVGQDPPGLVRKGN